MRTTVQRLGVTGNPAQGAPNFYLVPGFSPWTVVDHLQRFFSLSLAALPSSDFVGGTLVGQFTCDPQDRGYDHSFITISRSGTTATVTDLLGHGLSTGDAVAIFGGGAPFDTSPPAVPTGSAQVTVTSATQYTYTVANAGPTSTNTARQIIQRVFALSGITGAARVVQGFTTEPITAVRLQVTGITAGEVDWIVTQGLGV